MFHLIIVRRTKNKTELEKVKNSQETITNSNRMKMIGRMYRKIFQTENHLTLKDNLTKRKSERQNKLRIINNKSSNKTGKNHEIIRNLVDQEAQVNLIFSRRGKVKIK